MDEGLGGDDDSIDEIFYFSAAVCRFFTVSLPIDTDRMKQVETPLQYFILIQKLKKSKIMFGAFPSLCNSLLLTLSPFIIIYDIIDCFLSSPESQSERRKTLCDSTPPLGNNSNSNNNSGSGGGGRSVRSSCRRRSIKKQPKEIQT